MSGSIMHRSVTPFIYNLCTILRGVSVINFHFLLNLFKINTDCILITLFNYVILETIQNTFKIYG
jgi:hypothetical protein